MTVITYTRNQPVTMDDLDVSQPYLVTNTNGADDIFGKEHYPFSNQTVSQGLHNTVTTPAYIASPPTGNPPITAANPIFYGFEQTMQVGMLQYSRGPNNAPPTPVTALQSPITPQTITSGGTITVLNFTGLPRAIATIYAFNSPLTTVYIANQTIYWDGTTLYAQGGALNLQVLVSGTTLQLKNNTSGSLTGIYWTLQFVRMQ